MIEAILHSSVKKLYKEFKEEGILNLIYGTEVDFDYFQSSLISYGFKQSVYSSISEATAAITSCQKKHGRG